MENLKTNIVLILILEQPVSYFRRLERKYEK